MRVRIVANVNLDCAPMLVLEAESDSDILLLRFFQHNCMKGGGVQIGSFGGNIDEGRWSLNIHPRPDAEQPPPTVPKMTLTLSLCSDGKTWYCDDKSRPGSPPIGTGFSPAAAVYSYLLHNGHQVIIADKLEPKP